MKKNILLAVMVSFMVSFFGCETGTRYDKNESIKTLPKHELHSGLVERKDIEALLDDDKEEIFDDTEEMIDEQVESRSWIDTEAVKSKDVDEWVSSFSDTVVKNRLDVIKIREGRHEGYLRLVFDVYENSKSAKTVGHYDAKYISSQKDISVILYGYQKFSAPLPSFPLSSSIEQIYFEQYPTNQGFKFHIKLREKANVKIFELKNPARLIFDIKPI